MRSVSKLWAIAALATMCLQPADAAPIIVNTDTTISSNATGDDGATGLNDAVGFLGGGAVIWSNTNVDVNILTGYTFTGGLGGLGGPDAASNGGNQGGWGGAGLFMPDIGGTVTASGVFVYGGSGGNGSDGDVGGASDTSGGVGGTGGYGINAFNDGLQVTLTNTIVTGASGGTGGAAGDAGGDAGDDMQGGAGGYGGIGIATQGLGSTISISGSSVITGGNGGAGGTSLPNATNATGGGGGEGIYDIGTNTVITIGIGSTVQGGDGGAAGTGGSDGSAGADASGVWLQGTGATLTNYGAILGGGLNAAALAIVEDTSKVDNYGNIGAASDNGPALTVDAATTLATLHNHTGAFIHSSADFGETIRVTGAITTFLNEGTIANTGASIGVRIEGGIGSFTNGGTIQSTFSAAMAIYSADMADIIDNTGGLITNNSAANAAIGIVGDLGAAGVLFKGGQITNAGGAPAIRFFDAQTGTIDIQNATINGGVLFSAANETLNVVGSTLNGDIAFTAGNNNLNFLSGGTTTIQAATQFQNTNFFSLLEGATVVSDAVQSDANSSIGQVTTIVNSILTLNEDFWTDDEVLNQGTIAIAAGKTLTSNIVNGDGTYAFGVADATTVGKIEAQGTGSSIDFTGATLQIALDNPTDNFVAGTNFLLAEDLNGNAIIGATNGTVLLDNSALLTFILYRGDASQIGLTSDLLFAQIGQLLLADIASHGDDPNAIALGAALDIIGLDGNVPLDDLMLDLALLGTDAEINAVLDSLLPETDGVAYDIATDAGDQILDVASRRLDGLRGTSVASLEYKLAGGGNVGLRGGLDRKGVEIWGQGFGRIVNQRRHDYNDGYDADGFGFAVGVDTPFDGGKSLIGAAFAHGQTDADSNTINRTKTDVDSSQLVVYGDHVFDSRTYAKGMLGYGWHQNDIARHDVGGPLGPTVTANYDAWQFTARAETGRPYKGGSNLTLIPHLTANYAHYDPDDYRETDASAGDAIPAIGGLGLDVKTKSLQSFRIGLGVLARWDIELDANALLQPELRLNYRRELIGDRFETTSEFVGAPGLASFETLGVDPARDILDLGLGALLATAGGVDVRASYDLELKDSYTAHAGYVRASLPF